MKGVQCYELFGRIALKNHTFSFESTVSSKLALLDFIHTQVRLDVLQSVGQQ